MAYGRLGALEGEGRQVLPQSDSAISCVIQSDRVSLGKEESIPDTRSYPHPDTTPGAAWKGRSRQLLG